MDKVINIIRAIQKGVYYLELFLENKKAVGISMLILFVLAIGFAGAKKSNMAIIFLVMFYIIILLFTTTGWHSSARRFFKMVLFMDLPIIILCLFLAIKVFRDNNLMGTQFINITAIIYFLTWIFLSLIAKPKVARLVNEVMSVATTILFTAGTYYMSMKYGDYNIPDIITQSVENSSTYNSAIIQQQLQNELVKFFIYELGNAFFLLLLPYLCVSLFSMGLISIKEYWLNKRKEKDYWSLREEEK
jgi:hypothetical protein